MVLPACTEVCVIVKEKEPMAQRQLKRTQTNQLPIAHHGRLQHGARAQLRRQLLERLDERKGGARELCLPLLVCGERPAGFELLKTRRIRAAFKFLLLPHEVTDARCKTNRVVRVHGAEQKVQQRLELAMIERRTQHILRPRLGVQQLRVKAKQQQIRGRRGAHVCDRHCSAVDQW